MQRYLAADNSVFSTAGLKPREQFDYWCELVCDEFVLLDCQRQGRGQFNGEIRSDKLDKIQLSEVISDPQHVVRSKRQISKSHESEFLLSLQLSSVGKVSQDGREAILHPGDFAIYDSTRPYALDFQSPFQQLVLQIPHSILCQHLHAAEDYTAIAISSQAGTGLLASQFLTSVAGQTRALGSVKNQIEDNIFNLLSVALGSSRDLKQIDSRSAVRIAQLQRIKRFIETNLHNERLSPKMIAKAFQISTRYLHKLFETEEISLSRHILKRRLDMCMLCLQDKRYRGHSIEQIAFSWGFNSAPHFSKAFKDCTGLSPRSYRNKHLET